MCQRGSHWTVFVEFAIRDFYENLSPNSKFGCNRTTISGTLHEDLRAFHIVGSSICDAQYRNASLCFQSKAFHTYYIVDNDMQGMYFCSSMATLFTRTRHNVTCTLPDLLVLNLLVYKVTAL
jgi:hypothetical protein